MPLLTRKAQVVVVAEGTEGTAATLAAASGKMLVYDLSFEDTPDLFDRNPARSTLSRLSKVVGKQPAKVSWRTELKGSGSIATRPAWDVALRACGFSSAAISTITVSGMTGTFYPGESFTAGAKTGRIVGRHNSATLLYYTVTSGTLAAAATIVGDTSGAQCIGAGTPAASKGFAYRPISASAPSVTIGVYRDGMLHTVSGARGNVIVEAKAGEPAFLNFSFDGVYSSTTDSSLLAITYESTEPPAFLSATTYVDGLAAVFAQASVNMNNTVAQRESAAAAKGIVSYIVTERDPKVTIDPEMVLVASKDFYGRMHAANAAYFSSQWGSTAGNILILGSPRMYYEAVGQSDRNSIHVASLEFGCKASTVSAGDDEVQIAMR